MEKLCLYGAFARIRFLEQMEYRGQYVVRMLAKVMGLSAGFFTLLILLEQFGGIGGWGKYEILLLYAFDTLSYAIAGTFFMGAFNKLPRLIRSGELDAVLTKPVNPMVYLVCTKISAGYTSNYMVGIAIICICFEKLGVRCTPASFFWLTADIAGAAMIQGAAFIATAVPAFWLLKSDGLYRLLFRNLTELLRYPLSIYHKGVQFLLTFILPYGFINYYPVQYFLGREQDGAAWARGFRYMTPAVGAVAFFLSYRFWKIGLQAYESSGS